jgi:hypothetical protein
LVVLSPVVSFIRPSRRRETPFVMPQTVEQFLWFIHRPELGLTESEFSLLQRLLDTYGFPVSVEDLTFALDEKRWGRNHRVFIAQHDCSRVNTLVSRLRRKLFRRAVILRTSPTASLPYGGFAVFLQ